MIQHSSFTVEPWVVRETGLDFDKLAQTESVFALANGHLGLRGNLDEGEPFGLPGTYLAGFYEIRPLPSAEAIYGNPEAGEARINVTDGKLIRLLVEDEPMDIRYGALHSHERVLDLRAGFMRRTLEWESPMGRSVRVTSTRLVSFAQRAIAAILYEVEALDGDTPVVVQSELVANQTVPLSEEDPRAAAALASPLISEFAGASDTRVLLAHSTRGSGLRMAAAMDHIIAGETGAKAESFDDLGRLLVTADLEPGKPLRIVKLLAYGWSSQRTSPAIVDQVAAALAEARHRDWDGLLAEQRAYLDEFWERADVEIDGDTELQQAVRFALFHMLQAGARSERQAIAAKGLTGTGYDGHSFWDTETFVLPALTYTCPHVARDALRWRHRTLELARQRARSFGLAGAAFPWRTIQGEECSGYWPAGTAAFHINADIADAVRRYELASDDDAFAAGDGLELLIETARLWRSLGHHDAAGRFRIDGVTGPDEYSAIADNNIYTNLMAERNLRSAVAAAQRRHLRAAELGVDDEELAAWRDAADAIMVPYDDALQVHEQAQAFTRHEIWDFAATHPDQYPLMLHFPYFDLYRKQVVKQADLVLALHLRGDAFSEEQKALDFAYYERLTVRDSSLSACTQAVIAAEVGHLELAYDYLSEAALIDLDDLQHNTRDGLHIASLAGTWIGAVAGFGGLRDHDDILSFTPRLPQALSRIAFRLGFRGRRLLVAVEHKRATYKLLEGAALELVHHGRKATVKPGRALTRKIPPPPERKTPSQPPGRAPQRRELPV